MYPLPRVIYAMASDGLIFKWMGKVNSRFHTPMMGTFSAGLLTGKHSNLFFLIHLLREGWRMLKNVSIYRRSSRCNFWTESISQHDEHWNPSSLFHRSSLCPYSSVSHYLNSKTIFYFSSKKILLFLLNYSFLLENFSIYFCFFYFFIYVYGWNFQ